MTERTPSEQSLIPQEALRAAPRSLPASVAEHETLKRTRAAVQRALTEEFDRLLAPLGYVRTGDTWRKSSGLGRSAFQFQKSAQGFDAYLAAGVGPRWPGRELRFHRLAAFCPELGRDAPDALAYLRLKGDPGFRAAVLAVVRLRMIPWMETRHRLTGLLRPPSPADMRAIALFTDG